ncbi:MAG: NAD(P)-dependent oxidoreductase [Candidatus Rokubacteria bacterium]|nr:NAD(P)-dependent oxidoreductase [Candidatus Rokubacteria bacterium]
MAGRSVLVTGMSGLIGRALREHVEGRYTLRALNRSAVEGVPCHRADIGDLEAIAPAFEGVDTVVHLAADATSPNPPWESILHNNVTGTYNVYEAARRAKVKRVVFASSGATVSGIEKDKPYSDLVAGRYDGLTSWPMVTHLSPVRPAALYGVSKVWGEALGRQFADTHGLSVICVRIGRVHAEDRPMSPRDFAVWCSQRDIVRLLERCVEAPEAIRYDIFFGTSRNKWGYRDLEHPSAVLGWEPVDVAEDHR